MKVLHVSQPITGGVAGVVRQAVRHQVAAGLEVSVACPGGGLAVDLASAGADWHLWAAGREPGPATLLEAVALRRIVREVRPDVVHLHSSKAGLAGRLLRHRSGVVFQPHSWSFEAAGGAVGTAARCWERWAGRRTPVTVWCSWAEQAVGVRAGVRATGVVALNGVDLSRYRPGGPAERDAARRRLGLAPAEPVAVAVGRLAEQKGQDQLVRCWDEVRARVPGAVLVLAGDGPATDRIARAAGPGVRILGAVADTVTVYHAADLAVVPSRWEGMSLSMLEGLACGLPTVATGVSGAHEAVDAGDAPPGGIVVPPGDPGALVAAIADRLVAGAPRRCEGRAARSRAEQAFDQRAAMAAVVEAYRLSIAVRTRARSAAEAPVGRPDGRPRVPRARPSTEDLHRVG